MVLGTPAFYGGSDVSLVLVTMAVLLWPLPKGGHGVSALPYRPPEMETWIVDRPRVCRLCMDGPLWFPHH